MKKKGGICAFKCVIWGNQINRFRRNRTLRLDNLFQRMREWEGIDLWEDKCKIDMWYEYVPRDSAGVWGRWGKLRQAPSAHLLKCVPHPLPTSLSTFLQLQGFLSIFFFFIIYLNNLYHPNGAGTHNLESQALPAETVRPPPGGERFLKKPLGRARELARRLETHAPYLLSVSHKSSGKVPVLSELKSPVCSRRVFSPRHHIYESTFT